MSGPMNLLRKSHHESRCPVELPYYVALLCVFTNKTRTLCSNSHIFFIAPSHFLTMLALRLIIPFHYEGIKGIKITEKYRRLEPFVALKALDM
jgi:hypothetical protein